MKTQKMNRGSILYVMVIPVIMSGCSLAGLELQEDHQHEVSFADPNLDMTAWEFLNEDREDSLFMHMLSAIEHAGLEDEYTQTNRTFMLLVNDALYATDDSAGTILESCWYHKFVQGEEELDWGRVPEAELRGMLLYHIVDGEYSYDNLDIENTEVQTLSPDGEDPMYLKIVNDQNSKITANDFPGSGKISPARTAGLIPTNGVIHVFNGYLEYVPEGEESPEDPGEE